MRLNLPYIDKNTITEDLKVNFQEVPKMRTGWSRAHPTGVSQ